MYRIRILPDDREVECAADETVLRAVRRAGIDVAFGCKTGGCGTCKMRLLHGEIDDSGSTFALPADERDDGWFLPCSTQPRSDCVVDTGDHA